MEKEFWLERWQREEIGFHEGVVNEYLQQYWPRLNLARGDRVFVPLCGKAIDMCWLRDQGHSVTGVEISRIAVQSFFKEQGCTASHAVAGKFIRYQTDGIEINCGDFFDLEREDLQGGQAIYDRASMVALPPEMRARYVRHLREILPAGVKILLISFDYPQTEMPGPPFALPLDEVMSLYRGCTGIEMLAEIDALPKNPRFAQRGISRLQERIYLITL